MACTLIDPSQLDVAQDFAFSVLQTMGAGLRIPDSADDHYVTIDVVVDQAADRALNVPPLAGTGEFVVTNSTNAQTIINDLILSGDLTVNGTTTTINSTNVQVDDPIITLGTGVDEDIGILGDRSGTDAGLQYTESASRWQAGLIGSLSDILLASDIGVTVQAHGDVLDDLNTLGAAAADGEFIVATGAGVFAYESGVTARQSMGTFSNDEVVVTSTPYTALVANHNKIHVLESAAATVNLPAVAGATDIVLGFKRNGAGAITIDGASTETIDGTTTYSLATDHDTVWIYCDGTEWHVVAVVDNSTSPSTLAGQSDTDITSPASGAILRYDGSDSWDDAWTVPATLATGDILQASAADVTSALSAVATGNALISGGVGAVSSWGKIGLTSHVSGVLPEANGGTNQSTYTQGDILYASAADTLAKLAIGGANTVLHGGATIPSYSAVDLAADVTGITPVPNGGTGLASITDGAVMLGSGAANITPLALLDNEIMYGQSAADPAVITPAASSILVSDGSNIPAWSTTLPAHTLGGTVTGADQDITNVGTLNFGAAATRTIASGIVPEPANSYISIAGEGAAADTADGMADASAADGDILFVEISTHDIFFEHLGTVGAGEAQFSFQDEVGHQYRATDGHILMFMYENLVYRHIGGGGTAAVPATEMWVDQSETGDNSTVDWPLTVNAIQRSIHVFINGVYCQDYTETVANDFATNIVFGVAPQTGFDIRFKYMRAQPS